MDLLRDYAIDPQKENEGVWRLLARGVEVKIARVNNDEFRRLSRKKVKSNRASLDQDDDAAVELSEELFQEVYANSVLKDIRITDATQLPGGVLLIDGTPFEKYTPELGLKLLKNEPFRNKIKALAEDLEAYKLYAEENAVKS